MKKIVLSIILTFIISTMYGQHTIEFPSEDGLSITADLYEVESNDNPFIILFHQAGWSRGEYKEIAPKLNSLGYNCLVVDLRSGNAINDVENETYKRAKEQGKGTEFADAFKDVKASVAYAKTTYSPEKVILWGSSYSSSLVLKYSGDYPDEVNAVLSFSPGEYFKNKDLITSSATHIKIPVFITSAKSEKNNWQGIYDVIPSTQKQFFLPETKGNHGSRALWKEFSDSKSYWKAVETFLKTI